MSRPLCCPCPAESGCSSHPPSCRYGALDVVAVECDHLLSAISVAARCDGYIFPHHEKRAITAPPDKQGPPLAGEGRFDYLEVCITQLKSIESIIDLMNFEFIT